MVIKQIGGTPTAGRDDPRGLRVGPFLSEEQLWIRIEEEMDRRCLLAEKWSGHPADRSR